MQMSLLILYGSIEGQTKKIAQFAADELIKAGQDVRVFDAAERTTAIPFDGVDKVILAGSVHERRHPKDFEVALSAHKKQLSDRKTLLVSVSLSAAFDEGQEEAQEYVTELKMRTGLEPDAQALVAGAVRSDRYDYFATQVVRHVVLRDRSYDPTEGTHEFTDWDALAATLRAFAADDD